MHSHDNRNRSRSPLRRQTPTHPSRLHGLPTGNPHLPGQTKLSTHLVSPHLHPSHIPPAYLPEHLSIHASPHARMTELSRPPDYLLHSLGPYSRSPVLFPPEHIAALYPMYRPTLYGAAGQSSLYPGLPHVALHNPYRPGLPPNP